ncbi:hypothetical protein AAH978_09310 [Streptomyces sp. ZYX-F-203]
MPTHSTDRPTIPPTVWPAHGRYVGSGAEESLRRTLRLHRDDGSVDAFRETPEGEEGGLVFEARWRVSTGVPVRSRLSLAPSTAGGREWTLLAEAEAHWDLSWPSPAGMFWPDDPEIPWDRDAATGLRLRGINALPEDDRSLRRLLRDAARHSWQIHVVVHEAMTPDHRGRVPLSEWLPPSLRHGVVEHRAAPRQLRTVNWALRSLGVQVPRGGAVVLPGPVPPSAADPAPPAVLSVFLDGSEPADLIATVVRFATAARPLPDGAAGELDALREEWGLFTPEEELARERRTVALYAEALEAMTRSRDLYREAAERANEALAAYREAAERPPQRATPALRSLVRALDRRGRSAEVSRD